MKNGKRWTAWALTIFLLAGMSLPVQAAGKQSKEEVVYANLQADGTPEQVYVVNILNGGGSFTDYGAYSSVRNMTTTDELTHDAGTVKLQTDANRLYYEGMLENKELPWHIGITYMLDGQKVTAEQAAGKTGKLEIGLSIIQNKQVDESFFKAFALQATVSLDSKTCSNISADGATVANAGGKVQATFTVLPGKEKQLKISADVTDFELEPITVNGIRMALDIEVDDSALKDEITELQKGAAELDDGASELQDGAKAAKDGAAQATDGVKALQDGAAEVHGGAGSLYEGITLLQDGLDELGDQSSTLTGGSAQVLAGLEELQGGLQGMSVSTDQLDQLTEASGNIKEGIGMLAGGIERLQGQVSYAGFSETMGQNGLDLDQLKQGNTDAVEMLQQQIGALQNQVGQITVTQEQLDESQVMLNGMQEGDEGYAELQAAIDSMQAALQAKNQLEGQLEMLQQTAALLGGNNAALDGAEQYLDGTAAGIDELVQGAQELKEQYGVFDASIATLAERLSGLLDKMVGMKSGVDELVGSYRELDDGLNAYTGGIAKVIVGYQKLYEGAGALVGGTGMLADGAGEMQSGTGDLLAGLSTLYEGTQALADGTGTLRSHTEGMDGEIKDKINEMTDSMTGSKIPLKSFVSDKNQKVKAVQFVLKTDPISKAEAEPLPEPGAPEKTWWQKLFGLFGWEIG